YNTLISIMTAVIVVLGMKMMGALLISSLIIFPSLTSMKIFKSFRSVTICSAILSVVNFVIGLIASYGLNLPAGASVVVANLVVYILFSIVSAIIKKRQIA
ncbi:MAG: metal ABC transporter permease, partial [Eubacterium sp.]